MIPFIIGMKEAQVPEDIISPEAEARKTIDALKAQVAEATKMAQETLVRDRLVQQFAKQGRTNPFDLATAAIAQLKDLKADSSDTDLEAQATTWFETQRAIFAADPNVAPPSPAPTAPLNPFSGAQPNLTAPGLAPNPVPVVIGSKEYAEQWANKPVNEQIAAMKTGGLVSSDKVRLQQQEPSGILR